MADGDRIRDLLPERYPEDEWFRIADRQRQRAANAAHDELDVLLARLDRTERRRHEAEMNWHDAEARLHDTERERADLRERQCHRLAPMQNRAEAAEGRVRQLEAALRYIADASLASEDSHVALSAFRRVRGAACDALAASQEGDICTCDPYRSYCLLGGPNAHECKRSAVSQEGDT